MTAEEHTLVNDYGKGYEAGFKSGSSHPNGWISTLAILGGAGVAGSIVGLVTTLGGTSETEASVIVGFDHVIWSAGWGVVYVASILGLTIAVGVPYSLLRDLLAKLGKRQAR